MAAVIKSRPGGRLSFFCPGCELSHEISTQGSPAWNWNGDAELPTFSPSVLATSGHYARADARGCWCTYAAAHPDETDLPRCNRCHSFVHDGQIEFLTDCTHALAGTTVPIPEWPQGWE